VAAQPERQPVIAHLLDAIDVNLKWIDGRVETYVQMLRGIAHRTQ